MMWLDSGHISRTLEAAFNDILSKRMQGFPLLNSALSVQSVGFKHVNEDWVGVLVTPWFMNLVLMPGQHSVWQTQQSGSKIAKRFPYGEFEFTLGSEPQLGSYAFCSLFSPMFQFDNQDAAIISAHAALQGLLAENAPRSISRRDLLRGAIGNGKP